MSHRESIKILSALFRPNNADDARPTLLLGAGASFSSGIPLADESVRRLAKRVYADKVEGGNKLPEQIKPSEWEVWLQGQPWFKSGSEHLAENFPLVVEHLLTPAAYRRNALMELMAIKGNLGAGYTALAELAVRGLAGTILTTNFDLCLPKALNAKHPHIKHVAEVNRDPNDFAEFGIFNRAQIVWLHGNANKYTDRNLIEETQTLDSQLVGHLRPLLDATPLIVIGYRGAEPSIMHSLLGDQGQKFRNGIFWCSLSGEAIHPNVEVLASRLGSNFQHLEIDGFDEIIDDINTELVGVKRIFAAPKEASKISFDERACTGATWADIDAGLALSKLKEYCEKIKRSALMTGELKSFMREMRLLVTSEDGEEKPSNGCILLFGKDPQRFFPHSIIVTAISGKKRKNFCGNLIKQHDDVLEWIQSADINPEIKVKRKKKHVSQKSYPPRALTELLANMIVHRDYSIKETSKIDVDGIVGIKFLNPGKLTEASKRELKPDEQGSFCPVPEFSDIRNPGICDVFFGMNAVERAGTGLSDARSLCADAGGSASFAFLPEDTGFSATLMRPDASAGSSGVSIDRRPIGTYTVNSMMFSALPESVTHLQIGAQWSDVASLQDAGLFILDSRTGNLWTFIPPAKANKLFAPFILQEARSIPLTKADSDPGLHMRVAWLIRKHFEQYLKSFRSDGLVIERNKRGYSAKRAYFESPDMNNRTIIYDSPNRRNIRRDVVKKRGEETGKTWFECEGFGYEIIHFGGGWGVRIKPFYMFTGEDGVTPSPGFLRTKRSVRRIKFDRNASVGSDLLFWARFLSEGQQTLNIGGENVPDLLLEGSFLTLDVTEEGLDEYVDSDEDRSAG